VVARNNKRLAHATIANNYPTARPMLHFTALQNCGKGSMNKQTNFAIHSNTSIAIGDGG